MESVRVLSRSSASSSSSSSGAVPPSTSSSIPLSSASIPYTPPPPSSSFNHTPRYPPPLPSQSHLNPASSGRGFPSSNTIHPGAKITILTSSASSLFSSVTGSSSSSNEPPPDDAHTPFPTTSEQGNLSTDASPPPVEYLINGVVVVGVIGRSDADLAQLLDRIIDSQVFGSQLYEPNSGSKFPVIIPEAQNNEDGTNALNTRINTLATEKKKERPVLQNEQEKCSGAFDTESEALPNPKALKRLDWMRRRLKYYHDEEKGTVYVQFAFGSLPSEMISKAVGVHDLPGTMEECEKNTLRGLLFMFSVCHVIILLQENGRVDTHLLRTLRILQNAKHLLAPFVKTHVLPGIHPAVPSLERSSLMKSSSNTTNQSPGRSGGSVRSTSTIALMSGSAPSFFPGQCTPVLLFVFLEDFSDAASSHHERSDPTTTQVAPQAGGSILASRQTVQLKGSNPVVMLARATSKAEGGLRKKLQSSLEAQIRYLVKKCKILAGSGDSLATGGSGVGPRGPGSNMGASSGALGGSSLFVLDTMRVACLLNKGPNLKGDSLEAAMRLMNDMLSGKDVPDNALAGLTGNVSEDIQAIKDFIWKQGEILRGRGGVLTNSTAGSMGVGMVAAAAAAAAASAAAGGFGSSSGAFKPLGNPPELPSMSNWLSACHILMERLSAGEGSLVKAAKKIIPIRVPSGSRRGASEPTTSVHGKDALEVTLGSLESGTELDMNFSADWCKRMFPSALSVYTKALPPCYTTLLHQSHLQKALRMFQTKVRGPAVPSYMKKLTEECEIIWKSGRQLCDAISLTGRPCIHRIHDVQEKGKKVEQLDQSDMEHAKPHSSGLVFLHACACGRSRKLREDPFDYESANTTFFHFPNCEELLPTLVIPDCEVNKPMGGSAWSLVRLGGAKYYQKSTGLLQSGFSHNKKYLLPWIISYVSDYLMQGTTVFRVQVSQANQQENISKKSRPLFGTLSFLDALEHGKGGAMRDIDMQTHKQSKGVDKTVPVEEKQPYASSLAGDDKRLFADVARSNFEGEVAFPPLQQRQLHNRTTKQVGVLDIKEATKQLGQPEPQIALSTTSEEKKIVSASASVFGLGNSTTSETFPEAGSAAVKHAVLYVGFEHECPHGHRFLLVHEQVEALGSIGNDCEQHKTKDVERSKNGQKMFQNVETVMSVSADSIVVGQRSSFKMSANVRGTNSELSDTIPCKIVNDGSGEGYALLNTNLPLYMNCPHCNKSSEKRKKNSPAFAGNISQLQRIFLVTPPLPLLVAACPMVQFSDESISQAMKQEAKSGSNQFSLGCDIVLPPESFVVLRLPFIYYVELQDGSKSPLKCNVSQPESTGWLVKGSTFKVISDTPDA